MEKGRYLLYTGEQCSNFQKGKLYPIVKEGDIVKKGGREIVVVDDVNKRRAFSLTDTSPDVYYKTIGEIVNVNHTIDDLLDKYNSYKLLLSIPSDDSVEAQKQNKRYTRIITIIESKIRMIINANKSIRK